MIYSVICSHFKSLNFLGHPLRSHWESFRENLLIKSRNQNIFEKFKLNRNLQTIFFNMMYNMSMLRHWFSNEQWGGGALNHLPLLFCKSVYYQFHLSVKTRLPKLHRSSRLFDWSVCIFFTHQMESDLSIYSMPPTDRELKDEQSKSPFYVWLIIAQSNRSIFQPAVNQFSNILTCHFEFDEGKIKVP